MIISLLSLVIGVASLLYFIVYALWAGINGSFTLVWAVFGVWGIGYAFLHRWILQSDRVLLKRIEQVFLGMVLICLIIIFFVLSFLVREGGKYPSENADYVVVLGAHVYGEKMSSNLQYRVEAAYEYLQKNPETKVVLSGGRGNGEDITEAEAMRRFLADKGIAQERMLLEETSTNTEENIKNSAILIGDKKKSVIIVSNAFHLYRAKGIAKKQGYENVSGIGTKIKGYTVPNCYAREVIAVIKYKIYGQIS